MALIRNQPGWWANLPLIESGKRVLEAAQRAGFECPILTKGPKAHSNAWKEKLD